MNDTIEKAAEISTLAPVLLDEYAPALESYLLDGGEEPLLKAYELGRKAIVAGLGVLDVVAIHQRALVEALTRTPEDSARVAKASEEFFSECLAPFEMAIRGFQETSATLRQLNETLERQVAERTDAVRKSEHRYRTLVEGLPQKVFLKDTNSVYVSCNGNCGRDLKINPDEIAGKTDKEIEANRGKQFDPQIADLFCQIRPDLISQQETG